MQSDQQYSPVIFNRDLVIYDLETTNLNLTEAKIISVGVIRIYADGRDPAYQSTLLNPRIPIPAAATEVNKITEIMVHEKPTFRDIYKNLYEFMKDSVLCGFSNNHYDNAILCEEFARCGYNFPTKEYPSIDTGQLYKMLFPRTLSDLYREITKNEYLKQNPAGDDAEATRIGLFGLFERFPHVFGGKTLTEIASMTLPKGKCDWAGNIALDEKGEYVFNFGKNKGKRIKDDIGYGHWMINDGKFTENTRMYVRVALGEASPDVLNSMFTYNKEAGAMNNNPGANVPFGQSPAAQSQTQHSNAFGAGTNSQSGPVQQPNPSVKNVPVQSQGNSNASPTPASNFLQNTPPPPQQNNNTVAGPEKGVAPPVQKSLFPKI